MNKKIDSFDTLASWIIAVHLGIQIILFLASIDGISQELEYIAALSQFGLAFASIAVLWVTRSTTPESIGPSSFVFRTGVLWGFSNFIAVLNHWDWALKYGPIAFIASEITGTVFSLFVLSVIGLVVSTRIGLLPWIAQAPAGLIGLTFVCELSAALFWSSPPTWFFLFLSITEAASAILALWMLKQWNKNSDQNGAE